MPQAPLPADETARLRALQALEVLDSPSEEQFDDLVALASTICGVPVSLISLVDAHRQWFKANKGLPGTSETPREFAFCAHTILGDGVMEVPDATQDSRFTDNALVTGGPQIRFYAGAPLTLSSGQRIGSLCVIDSRPRVLSDEQRTMLERLSRVATRLLEQRAGEATLAEERRVLAGVIEATEVATWEWDVANGDIQINERWAAVLGYTAQELQPVNIERFRSLLHPDDSELVNASLREHFAGRTPLYDCEIRMRHRDGHWIWLQTRGRVLDRAADGSPLRMSGVHLDIDARKGQEQRLARSQQLLEATGRIAGVGGYELDLLSGELTWTDQTKRIHGVPLDYEPTLEEAINFYAPEAREEVESAIQRVIESGEEWEVEVPLIRPDGKRIWVLAQGSVEQRDGVAVRLFGAFQDVTARRELTEALAEKSELLHVTLQSIGDAVITTDAGGRITWMNPVAERLTGCRLAAAAHSEISAVLHVVHDRTREPLEDAVSRCIASRSVANAASHAVLLARDGNEYAVEISAAPIVNAEDHLLGAVMVIYDVTEQRRLTSEISYRANHDALTGLANRSSFESSLREALADARERGRDHTVLYLDLDQFKIVNDVCGHSAGDELLMQVAELFNGCVRSADTVARLGGDEFAIILERCPAAQAERLASKLCDAVRGYRFCHGDHQFRIGVSIGLVPLRGDWPSTSSVMQAADTACYAAKEAGRDRVHRYEEGDAAIRSQQSRTRWAMRIEQALEQNLFVLHGQRIHALDGDAPVERVELLIRLQESSGRLVMPGAFIPAAERFRLMTRIDRWVFERALEIAAWSSAAAPREVFVNLSGQSLGDRALHEFVTQRLADAGREVCGRLVVEVTETAVIANLSDAREFLQALRELGVRIALDDFGSGMASYSYLRALSFDFLKIDGHLVATMLDDPLSLAAVRSFVDVARVLALPVIAEHVESEQTLKALEEMGVDFVQGFLLHRPELLATDGCQLLGDIPEAGTG
jgi:diguanylate cyclase (GGDEF)-like protein/PAS domain S-box-containing protein